jgi:hypothetical protein
LLALELAQPHTRLLANIGKASSLPPREKKDQESWKGSGNYSFVSWSGGAPGGGGMEPTPAKLFFFSVFKMVRYTVHATTLINFLSALLLEWEEKTVHVVFNYLE